MANIIATGGTITYTDSNGANPRASKPYAGGYKIHTFTTVETTSLEVTVGGDVDYLVIAGGGSGGTYAGGGGGAGGYRTGTLTLTSGSKTVTVGAGGGSLRGVGTWNSWADVAKGDDGDNSVFDSITATGGGCGGRGCSSAGYEDGNSGGSGGGGGWVPGDHSGDGGIGSQGNDGGSGQHTDNRGGGGGGKGSAGAAAAANAGDGGTGLQSSISGVSTYYAAGGGGSTNVSGGSGTGGSSIGGNGGTSGSLNGTPGTDNRGAGGGGAYGGSPGGNYSGAGGSGIVIIRYPFSNKMTGGDTTTYTDSNGVNPRSDTPYAAGYVVHTYTTVGNSTLEVTAGMDVDYLVVAGGGAGSTASGGGGGAGGFRTGTLTITTGSKTVTIGNGGQTESSEGGNSVFDSIMSTGGGGGTGGTLSQPGHNGGSGGGGTSRTTAQVGGDSDYLTPKQGYDGGAGWNSGNQADSRGGGGGGASQVGFSGSAGGNGGAGTSSSISGVATYYAGGGGGGTENYTAGIGGIGGGGNGARYPATTQTVGAVNTGGGGGAGYSGWATGGSGIVIVRYALPTISVVTTQSPTSILDTTCLLNGTIVSVLQDHTDNIRGFCYKLASSAGDPTISDSVISDTVGGYTVGSFTKNLTGLTAGTVYKVRAYATDDHSTEYGETVTVSTLGTIETDAASNITWNSVVGNADVTNVGASALTAKGICYCLASAGTPTVAGDKVTTTGSSTGAFALAISGLTKETDYHLRAYATNTEGTFYGETADVATLARTTANVERLIEIDFMEYTTDALAQAEYVSSLSGAFQCFSESTIKTQGDNSLKIVAGTGGGVVLEQTGGAVTYTDEDGLNPRETPAYDAGWTVVTFVSSGHVDVSTGGTVEYLLVGGGGGGAKSGGGGGGVLTGTASLATGEHLIVVGDGGYGADTGDNTTAFSLTAYGGGCGVAYDTVGGNGASGGGGASDKTDPEQTYAGGTGSQGYNGGSGRRYSTSYGASGGAGGGASAVGGDSVTGPGTGGAGTSSSISGVAKVYGSGGAGYVAQHNSDPAIVGTPGTNAGSANAEAVDGCGGGGGGSTASKNGGSGIVIIRYQTPSSGQTLTRTLSGTEEICNLSYVESVSFDMRASRTGSNIKIGLHDTSATTEITPNIIVADTWQEVIWDLSAVSNANKDDIHQIIITVMNADDDNTIYLDNFKIVGTTVGLINNIYGWVT